MPVDELSDLAIAELNTSANRMENIIRHFVKTEKIQDFRVLRDKCRVLFSKEILGIFFREMIDRRITKEEWDKVKKSLWKMENGIKKKL